MPDLHPAQFANQMALPGMEHLAHPWAKPLSRGYHLDYSAESYRNHLEAVKSGVRGPDATLSWANKHNSGGADAYHPGEIVWVGNTSHVRGMGEALMRSAHHFDFGQDTVPIHSPERTPAGKKFSDRVMPELKPDIWRVSNREGSEAVYSDDGSEFHGYNSSRRPQWNLPENLHPYQQQDAERDAKKAAGAASKQSRRPVRSQGKLF